LIFGVESASPIICMIRPGTAIRHTPNNTKQRYSRSVAISHRKYYERKKKQHHSVLLDK
jgi:hypothetical protein